MSHKKNFETAIKTLNSQLWVLLTLCEHSAGLFSQMPSLDGLPHQKVIPAIFNHSKNHFSRIRLKNSSLSSDMVDLTTQAEKWLPAYFLILAKSILEGVLNDIFVYFYENDPEIKSKIDKRKKRKKRSRSKEIESISQAFARGSFSDVAEVFDISIKLADHLFVSRRLNKYSRIRNKMVHNLNGQYIQRSPVTVDELKKYLETTQNVVSAFTI